MLRDSPSLFVYIDDILVSSLTVKEYEHHLGEIFTCLSENNLMVNLDKCFLAKPTVTFFGHTVYSEGIRSLPEKVTTIRSFPPPSSELDVIPSLVTRCTPRGSGPCQRRSQPSGASPRPPLSWMFTAVGHV